MGRTKTGVLLLLVGTLLSIVPVIGALGSLLILIGVILVILGRKAFGPSHARNVVVSIVLFFVGIIIAAVGVVVLIGALASSLFGGQAPTPAAVQSAMNTFLIIVAVGTMVNGLASVFFTYALQDRLGRMLLLGAYGASVAIQVAIFAIVAGELSQFIEAMFPGGTYDPVAGEAGLASFQARVTALGLLLVIPSLMYAAAYYLVWNRINKREIPAPTTPMAPPAMPPTPPM